MLFADGQGPAADDAGVRGQRRGLDARGPGGEHAADRRLAHRNAQVRHRSNTDQSLESALLICWVGI